MVDSKWLIPLNKDISPEKDFTDNQGRSRYTVINLNYLWPSLFFIKS